MLDDIVVLVSNGHAQVEDLVCDYSDADLVVLRRHFSILVSTYLFIISMAVMS